MRLSLNADFVVKPLLNRKGHDAMTEYDIGDRIHWKECSNEAIGTIIKMTEHQVWVDWDDDIAPYPIAMYTFKRLATKEPTQ